MSGAFGDARGFALRRETSLNAVRDILIGLTDGALVVATAMLGAGLVWPAYRVLRTRVLAFAVTSYALGPGLLVNAVLKSHSGRARPWNVDLFGGDAAFTPVLNLRRPVPVALQLRLQRGQRARHGGDDPFARRRAGPATSASHRG